MALTRLTGNRKGDTKPDARQQKTPGRLDSASSPAAKLPSVKWMIGDATGSSPRTRAWAVKVVIMMTISASRTQIEATNLAILTRWL